MTHKDIRLVSCAKDCCVAVPFFQDSSQIGLLKELLDLQKDMVVMLLSLLEGDYASLLLSIK